MDKDPALRKIALIGATKLCSALAESLERESELINGEKQDYDKTPSHIVEELSNFTRFL